MGRKKWTPVTEITESLLKFREKRKWQLALRRYVLERNSSSYYAFYFGLEIEQFRDWIEIQFTEGLNWQNFGAAWQFDHIVPVGYFDFTIEEDLKVCWNFINIRVQRIELNKNTDIPIDIIAVKPYFQALYDKTGYSFCLKMLAKITLIQDLNRGGKPLLENFIKENKERLEMLSLLNRDEFNSLNKGISLHDIFLEREILKKFG